MASWSKCLRFFISRQVLRVKPETSMKNHSKLFSTSKRLGSQDFQQMGIPGANLPFRIDKKGRLTICFILFFGIALNAPFIIIQHSLMLNYVGEEDD